MEAGQEYVYQSFSATESRQKVVRKLLQEFVGVELKITPTKVPGDFMKHVSLGFISVEQNQAFIRRMLEAGRQESRAKEPS